MKLPVLSRVGLAVLLVCAFSAPGAAQTPSWTPTGPFGGNVSLAVHPTVPGVLYAGVAGGVVRTRDAGASWQWLPRAAGLSAVAIDPTQPRTLYAASSIPPARVFKSTDEGDRWRVVSRNLPPHLLITRLVVDPARPSRLYLTATTGGVWRSGDGGVTWQPASRGLPAGGSTNVTAFVVPRKPGGTAFAGTPSSGLFRTRNAGGSWEPVGGGLPPGSVRVAALAVAPSDPRTLYASIEGAGVFRSRDGGNSWGPAGNPVPAGGISSLAVHPRSPLTVYGGGFGTGVFRTTDGGQRWTPTAMPPSVFITGLALDASAALYAGTFVLEDDAGGVLRSADGGASWERRNRGIVGLATLSVAVDAADPDNLVTTVNGLSLFRSANAAARWVPVRDLPPGRTGALTSEVIAGGAGTFYFVDPSRGPGRTWKSSDAGRTWAPLPVPEGTPQIVRADPLDPETLYALSLGGTLLKLFRSEDGGATWTLLPDLPATCTVFDLEVARTSASAPAVLYLAGSRTPAGQLCRIVNQPAVYRSTDGGATWAPADAGLPGEVVSEITVDPQDSRIVYVGLGAGFSGQPLGVWKSTDSGASWRATGLDDRIIRSLAASPEPGMLWAGALGGGVYWSTDFGETWQERGLPLDVFGFAFGPDRVYAATENGVWVLEETD